MGRVFERAVPPPCRPRCRAARLLTLTAFVHDSERRVAELLDAHGVRWEYEPRLFSLRYRRQSGKVVTLGFRPDFYLPDYDLYVEVTTLKTPVLKNRKLRLMAEQHPDVHVELFTRAKLGALLHPDGPRFIDEPTLNASF